jgi:myo-inositol-1(or 4)-monophosphatase
MHASASERELQHCMASAHALADLARTISLRAFRQPMGVEFKEDGSPVTRVDREVEAALRKRLAKLHPTHGIVGEEMPETGSLCDEVWHLDPIDGTKSYVCGLPLWGTLIALAQRDEPVLGVIDIPAMDERWSALHGGTAWLMRGGKAPEPCVTSGCARLSSARLCTPAPDAFSHAQRARVQRLEQHVAIRRQGGDCYAYGLLISGHLDLLVEAGLDAHDFLPMRPLIEAAGGVITDWFGRPLTARSEGDVIAAASAELHGEALDLLDGRGIAG